MVGGLIETEARKLKNEGIQEGIQIGVQEVAENMIRNQIPVYTLLTCTGLSLKKLQELSLKLEVELIL